MKIAVLLSGGVDSSVALRLLKDKGHDLTAFYLKIWLEDDVAFLGKCPWEDDLQSVQAVCTQANVPLEVVSLQREYWDSVVAYVIAEVKAGRTPNPDVLCNQQIKFGCFYDKIDSSFTRVATGHYARVERENGLAVLKISPDPIKDQTYFLAHLTQQQLSRTVFPLGDFTKEHVRVLAQQYDLPNKDRKDSQGICFLGKIKYDEFVQYHLGEQVGDIIELETGKKVGEHKGFWFYTIGQRKGLGLAGGPWYVTAKDIDKNVVYISNNYFSKDKARNEFNVGSFNWIARTPPDKQNLTVKIRHGAFFYNCRLVLQENGNGHVIIDGNDQGIAAGQFAVFYDGDICLGCGVIF